MAANDVHQSERQPSETPVVIGWAHWIVNGIFIAAILGYVALLVSAGVTGRNPITAPYGFLLLFYAMMLAVLLVILLFIHAFDARTLVYLKWPFALFALMCLVTMNFERVMPRLDGSDTVRLRVVNGAGVTIDKVEIFGRRARIEFGTLRTDSSVVAAYRGRKMKSSSGDSHPGQVRMKWLVGGQWRERTLVQSFGEIGDSLAISFPKVDSVTVKGWSGQYEWLYPPPQN